MTAYNPPRCRHCGLTCADHKAIGVPTTLYGCRNGAPGTPGFLQPFAWYEAYYEPYYGVTQPYSPDPASAASKEKEIIQYIVDTCKEHIRCTEEASDECTWIVTHAYAGAMQDGAVGRGATFWEALFNFINDASDMARALDMSQ